MFGLLVTALTSSLFDGNHFDSTLCIIMCACPEIFSNKKTEAPFSADTSAIGKERKSPYMRRWPKPAGAVTCHSPRQ